MGTTGPVGATDCVGRKGGRGPALVGLFAHFCSYGVGREKRKRHIYGGRGKPYPLCVPQMETSKFNHVPVVD